MDDDRPRSLRESETVSHLIAMLHQPHIAPLTSFVLGLRTLHPDQEYPYFDPLDGGVDADLLFLYEKPGRITSNKGNGSGFI